MSEVAAAAAATHRPFTSRPHSSTGRIEGLVTVEVTAFDWNCPKYITPRFTAEEVAEAVAPLRARIAELEALVQAKT